MEAYILDSSIKKVLMILITDIIPIHMQVATTTSKRLHLYPVVLRVRDTQKPFKGYLGDCHKLWKALSGPHILLPRSNSGCCWSDNSI